MRSSLILNGTACTTIRNSRKCSTKLVTPRSCALESSEDFQFEPQGCGKTSCSRCKSSRSPPAVATCGKLLNTLAAFHRQCSTWPSRKERLHPCRCRSAGSENHESVPGCVP